jgi:hypothetical protein
MIISPSYHFFKYLLAPMQRPNCIEKYKRDHHFPIHWQ